MQCQPCTPSTGERVKLVAVVRFTVKTNEPTTRRPRGISLRRSAVLEPGRRAHARHRNSDMGQLSSPPAALMALPGQPGVLRAGLSSAISTPAPFSARTVRSVISRDSQVHVCSFHFPAEVKIPKNPGVSPALPARHLHPTFPPQVLCSPHSLQPC